MMYMSEYLVHVWIDVYHVLQGGTTPPFVYLWPLLVILSLTP